MRLLNAIVAGLMLGAVHGTSVKADPVIEEWKTHHAMGCMLVGDCREGVIRIESATDVEAIYPNTDYSQVRSELDGILRSLNEAGVGVYISDEKYFPRLHRGVYHTVSNDFHLNHDMVEKPWTLMSVIRHEGWHAAQDCMAGTIDNSLIALIISEEKVPAIWRAMAEELYPPEVVPWEAEAIWAGKTEGMTERALTACARGQMWREFTPTPLTEQYLRENGWIK